MQDVAASYLACHSMYHTLTLPTTTCRFVVIVSIDVKPFDIALVAISLQQHFQSIGLRYRIVQNYRSFHKTIEYLMSNSEQFKCKPFTHYLCVLISA